MTKRHADVDLTEDLDSETQACVSAEDRVLGSPYQWIFMMTKIIIGAYHGSLRMLVIAAILLLPSMTANLRSCPGS